MKTGEAAWQPMPHPEGPQRAPSCASRNAAAEKIPSTAWVAGLGRRRCRGPRCFSYESQGLGWGGCCGILIVPEYVPNSRKERLALSYDPDTRRPHWLAQLINLGMENWFILGMKDPTTISFILCTSPRNGGSILYGRSADTLVVPSLGFPYS